MRSRNNNSKLLLITILICTVISSYIINCEAGQEEELFFVAQKAFEDGFYDIAIRYTNDFLEKYPATAKKVQAKLLLGQCYFFKSQYLKAYDIFHELLQYSELKDSTLFWLGETYLKGADYKQAKEHYELLIKDYPDSPYLPQAYYSLGWTFFEEGKHEEGQVPLETLLKNFPTHHIVEDALFKLAEAKYNLGEFQKSISLFKKFLLKFPKAKRTPEAYFYIAESYYYLEDYLKSSIHYVKVTDVTSDKKLVISSQVSLGWSYLKLERFQLAENAFEKANTAAGENSPLLPDIIIGLASLYSETNKNEKAITQYTLLIDSFPNSPQIVEAYLGRANIFYRIENYPQAIQEYKSLITQNSQNPFYNEIVEKAKFGLAWTYLKTEDTTRSIDTFRDILTATDSNIVKASVLTQIGDIYHNSNQLEKALELYDEVLASFSTSVYADYAQFRQGITLLKLNRIDSATLSFQSLQVNFPDSKHVIESKYYLAISYFKKENWPSAIDFVKEYLKEASQDSEFLAEANYVLAISTFNLNKQKDALKIFQTILKNFPEHTAIVKNAELGIARCFFQLGQVKEALKKFNTIILNYPKSEVAQEAILWLGDYYLENGIYDSAIEYFQQLISNFPGTSRIDIANYRLGQTYELKNHYDKAFYFFSKVTNPKNKEIYAKAKLAIGEIFSKKLDYETAIETYQNIIQSVPDYKRDAYVNMAAVYREKQNFDDAIKTYNDALRANIGLSNYSNAELQFLIGDTYELLNNASKAIEEYLKIPYLYPKRTLWVVKAYLRAGRIFEDKEQWKEAQKIYLKTIQLQTEEAKFAKERLDWIKENFSDYQKQ